jgi:Transmembrane secretion effector
MLLIPNCGQGWMLVTAAALGAVTILEVVDPWILLGLTFALGPGAAMNALAWRAIRMQHDHYTPWRQQRTFQI